MITKNFFLYSPKVSDHYFNVAKDLSEGIITEMFSVWKGMDVHEKAQIWLRRNSKRLEKSFSQVRYGLDQILHRGVCTGMVYRLLTSLYKDPLLHINSLMRRIDSKDRFYQAMHHIQVKILTTTEIQQNIFKNQKKCLEKISTTVERRTFGEEALLIQERIKYLNRMNQQTNRDILPPSLCRKMEVRLVATMSERKRLWRLGSTLKKLGPDQYLVLSISLSGIKGHTIGIQRDDKRGIYRFIDPSKGVWKFNEPDELIQELKEYISIFYFDYSEFYLFSVKEL